MDCSDFPERQTSSKRRLSPVYSAPRAAEPRRRQKSHASRKGRPGNPWGSSTGNVLVRGQQKCIERTMDPSFLLAFPLLLALLTPCNACVCKLLHPQSVYCLTEVVIIVDILGPGQISGTRRTFQVSVTKVLKAPKGTREIRSIYTPRRVEGCGYAVLNSHQADLLIAAGHFYLPHSPSTSSLPLEAPSSFPLQHHPGPRKGSFSRV
ncbi:Metalloproteinase inhibitor 1 [Plecturocebus cupreus]